MRKLLITLLKGILAGVAISLGGWLSLRANAELSNKIVGAFLFTLGLILIVNFDFYLYTGKICYVFDKGSDKWYQKGLMLLTGIIGNLLGCLLMGSLMRLVFKTKLTTFFDSVNTLVNNKISYEWYQIIILAFFCGMLVYLAVEGFKRIDNPFGKYVVLILCIAGFIICGFEHCVANMFYYALAKAYSGEAVLSIILCVIGNSLGGVFIPLINKLIGLLKGNESVKY